MEKRVRKVERGAAIVEFGLSLLPMMGFLFLCLDVAWIIFGWACIQQAAREGVRRAVAEPQKTTTTTSLCTDVLNNAIFPFSLGFVNAINAPDCSGGTKSVVKIDYYPGSGYSSAGMPAALTSGQIAPGNLVKITISGVTVSSFGAFYRSKTPVSLSASAADVLQ